MWRNEANDKNAGGIKKKILRSWRKWYDCEATVTSESFKFISGLFLFLFFFCNVPISGHLSSLLTTWGWDILVVSRVWSTCSTTDAVSSWSDCSASEIWGLSWTGCGSDCLEVLSLEVRPLKVLPFFGPPLLDLGGILQIDVNCTTGLWEMIILQLCNTWFVEFGYIRVTVVPLSYYVRATLVTFFVFVLHSPGFRLTFVSFSQYIPIVRLHFVSHSSLSVHSRVFFVLFSSYSFNLRVYSSLFRLYSSQTKNSRTSHEQGE